MMRQAVTVHVRWVAVGHAGRETVRLASFLLSHIGGRFGTESHTRPARPPLARPLQRGMSEIS
jgi:hypothetical protein